MAMRYVDVTSADARAEGRRHVRAYRGETLTGYMDVTRLGDCFWHQERDIGLTLDNLEELVSYAWQWKRSPPRAALAAAPSETTP